MPIVYSEEQQALIDVLFEVAMNGESNTFQSTVQVLENNGVCIANIRYDDDGSNILHAALIGANDTIVRTVLEIDAQQNPCASLINETCSNGFTPLETLLWYTSRDDENYASHVQVAKQAINTDSSVLKRTNSGGVMIVPAIILEDKPQGNIPEFLEIFLDTVPESIDIKDRQGRTLLDKTIEQIKSMQPDDIGIVVESLVTLLKHGISFPLPLPSDTEEVTIFDHVNHALQQNPHLTSEDKVYVAETVLGNLYPVVLSHAIAQRDMKLTKECVSCHVEPDLEALECLLSRRERAHQDKVFKGNLEVLAAEENTGVNLYPAIQVYDSFLHPSIPSLATLSALALKCGLERGDYTRREDDVEALAGYYTHQITIGSGGNDLERDMDTKMVVTVHTNLDDMPAIRSNVLQRRTGKEYVEEILGYKVQEIDQKQEEAHGAGAASFINNKDTGIKRGI